MNHRFGYLNWGLEAIGQFKSWEEIAAYPIDNDRQGNKTLRPGDIKYKDVNGDGVINGMDERPIGYREDSTPILNFRQELGVVLGGIDFYRHKRLDAITAVTRRFYRHWDEAACRRYMEAFELDGRKRVEELSAGMWVKYLIALALSHGARQIGRASWRERV